MTSSQMPDTQRTEEQIVGELKSLSVMERSRRYGVVDSPTGLFPSICKRRLPSPCSPDSALGSDDEITLTATTDRTVPPTAKHSNKNSDKEGDEDEEEETDELENYGEAEARTLRTPSVVISDHCDDPFLATSTLTLDQIEHLRAEYESDRTRRGSNTGGDSGSDCSATSSWSSWGLDPDYGLRNQRKISDCSTCSTLSGEEEDLLQPVILQPVVLKKMDRRATGSPVPRPRSLMENLLIAKMERAGLCPAPLMRMDSTDSTSSLASSSTMSSEVCRCDDCLLGIADLHISTQDLRKKVADGDCQMTGGSRRAERRSPSPRSPPLAAPGYEQYSRSLLDVPYLSVEYGEASSDDLSSEWDSDVPEPPQKPSGWRKLRNIVQWTPFFQTYKKQRYPWVQLAGHQGNFKAGPEPGTILKKLCPKEQLCFQILMKDILRPYVPEYKGHVTCDDGDGSSMYLQLQDLLGDFTNPCVMDCKIGVRTYLEEELAKAKEKPKLRKDMYEKMIQIDSNAPTEEEHRLKGVTKPRYMVWRETISSTATLGFRIEGIKKSDGKSSKDFKTTRTQAQIQEAFKDFAEGFLHAVPKYIQRLKAIKATLEVSTFFHTHEMIGSSLLFVHDQKNANVWLIDFAKTLELPKRIKIDHASSWVVGNHEDGYLIGINNLINIFSEMNAEAEAGLNTTLVVTAPTDAPQHHLPIQHVNHSHEFT